jgi:tRNA(Arg) A34 adenosine deaminase TadA
MHPSEITLKLPSWLDEYLPSCGSVFATVQERMQLVIELARLNVTHQTGGPFGAGIFELPSGRLLTVGVNVVTAVNCSVAHAEIMAISLAQQKLKCYDLSTGQTGKNYELVTSAEPCAMCLGAVAWSGVSSLVCGARDEDVRSVGFDEGAKPVDWAETLAQRNIAVTCDVLREQAIAVLRQYRDSGGIIYNPSGK